MEPKRVAIVSTCGAGHINTLCSLWNRDQDTHLFLVRFKNNPNPFEGQDRDRLTILTCNEDAPSEVAREFNEIRASKLQDALHVWLYDYNPTLIVYDFFCLEAQRVARLLKCPAICSIPATLKQDDVNTCSDALLPKEHFYWVWRHPYPVSIKPVAFLGPRKVVSNRLDKEVMLRRFEPWKRIAVVSFGTVVPKYDGCQERLHKLMVQLDQLIQQNKDVYFVFCGIEPLNAQHPNCMVRRDVNLPTLFTSERVTHLLFHGGGNTFAEALEAQVPYLLACPFFGDQFETARQCGNEYSGDLIADWERCKPYPYSQVPISLSKPFEDTLLDYWSQGDLLFGHSRHRETIQSSFPTINFHLNHFANFDTFANPSAGDLPAIADVYNDETSDPDLNTEYGRRLSDVRDARISMPHLHLPLDHRLVHYCIQILMLTIQKWKGRIHFVLGPLDELGPATKIELEAIRSLDNDSIIFYNLKGRRIPFPHHTIKSPHRTAIVSPLQHDDISLPLIQIPGRMPLVWGRNKSEESIEEKVRVRQLPVLDVRGWRTGYMEYADRQRVLQHLNPNFLVSVNWCKQNVWFFYYPHSVELQVWPWIYLHCFYLNSAGIETDRKVQHTAFTHLNLHLESLEQCNSE